MQQLLRNSERHLSPFDSECIFGLLKRSNHACANPTGYVGKVLSSMCYVCPFLSAPIARLVHYATFHLKERDGTRMHVVSSV